MDKGILFMFVVVVVVLSSFFLMSGSIYGGYGAGVTGYAAGVGNGNNVPVVGTAALVGGSPQGSGSAAAIAGGGSCGSGGGCGCGGGGARPSNVVVKTQEIAVKNGIQDVYVKALNNGFYDKPQVQVKKGVPVRFHFTADPSAGCGRVLIISEFNVQLVSLNGEEQVAEFTPTQAGTYMYRCGMAMWRGNLIVA